MPLEFRRGDLLAAKDLDAIAHGVNCEGVMYEGFAKVIKQRFPKHFCKYQEHSGVLPLSTPRGLFSRGSILPGHVLATYSDDFAVFHLCVKSEWRHPAKIAWARAALGELIVSARICLGNLHSPKRIGIPKIGCGLKDLDWREVRPLIEAAAALTHHTLVVFE